MNHLFVTSLLLTLGHWTAFANNLRLVPISPVTQEIADGLATLIEIQMDLPSLLSSVDETVRQVAQRINSAMKDVHIANTYEVRITKYRHVPGKQDSKGRQSIAIKMLVQDSRHLRKYNVKIEAYYKANIVPYWLEPLNCANKYCSNMPAVTHASLNVPSVTLDEIRGYASIIS